MIDYNPMDLFQREARLLRGSSPYIEFLDAAGKAWVDLRQGGNPSFRELLDWVHEYGLLGLFWHESIHIQEPSYLDGHGIRVARSLTRLGGQWLDNGIEGALGGDEPPKKGLLIQSSMGPYSPAGEPQVVPFNIVVGWYFEQFNGLVLHPSNEECRRAYRESIDELCEHGSTQLGDAVDGNEQSLNYLLAGSSDWVKPKPKSRSSSTRLEIGRVYASLFSALGWMIVTDKVNGQRFLHCEGCGRRFSSDRYQAKFCTDSCRSRVHKRKTRAAMTKAPKRADKPKRSK